MSGSFVCITPATCTSGVRTARSNSSKGWSRIAVYLPGARKACRPDPSAAGEALNPSHTGRPELEACIAEDGPAFRVEDHLRDQQISAGLSVDRRLPAIIVPNLGTCGDVAGRSSGGIVESEPAIQTSSCGVLVPRPLRQIQRQAIDALELVTEAHALEECAWRKKTYWP